MNLTKKNISKEIALSFIYLIVAPLLNFFVYFSIIWFLNNIVIEMLNWFNHLNLWIQVISIIFGITIFFSIIFNLGIIFIGLINNLIWKVFPVNIFTQIIAFLLAIYNIVYIIWGFMKLVPNWNLLYTLEFLIIAFLIIVINSTLIPRKPIYDNP